MSLMTTYLFTVRFRQLSEKIGRKKTGSAPVGIMEWKCGKMVIVWKIKSFGADIGVVVTVGRK